MSVCLLDINEQMHPVTTLKVMNQNHEIYAICWNIVFARLKYLENDFAACCYPGSEALVIFLIPIEDDAEDDSSLVMLFHKST